MDAFAPVFVRDHGLRIYREADTDAVLGRLTDALATGVFAVTSLAGIHALVAKADKITTRAADATAAQIAADRRAAPAPVPAAAQRGGNPTGLPSDYFGTPHASYSPANIADGVAVSTVQFDAGIARAAQGPQSGGAAAHAARAAHTRAALAAIRPEVQRVAEHHDLTLSQNALRDLAVLIHAQMDALAADLRAAGPLTVKKLDRVLALPRNKMFAA